MNLGNRKSTYLMLGVVGVAIAIALASGMNPAFLLVVAICPLVMFFMMRTMAKTDSDEDQRNHDREHDQSRREQRAQSNH